MEGGGWPVCEAGRPPWSDDVGSWRRQQTTGAGLSCGMRGSTVIDGARGASAPSGPCFASAIRQGKTTTWRAGHRPGRRQADAPRRQHHARSPSRREIRRSRPPRRFHVVTIRRGRANRRWSRRAAPGVSTGERHDVRRADASRPISQTLPKEQLSGQPRKAAAEEFTMTTRDKNVDGWRRTLAISSDGERPRFDMSGAVRPAALICGARFTLGGTAWPAIPFAHSRDAPRDQRCSCLSCCCGCGAACCCG